jgi:PPOX class probable F420-dependent enzyme
MSGERVREFVGAHRNAVLATYHADGRIQQSPVTVGLDAEGNVIISSRETAVKVRNLLRDPRVSLVALTEAFIGDWLLIEGEAEIVHLPEAMDGLVSYYRDLAGEHPDWDDYRAAMIRDRRVLVRIRATKVGPTIKG